MLKGAQKKMIVIKTSDSQIFEEAYFMVRGGVDKSQPDMVSEANRIIEDCAPHRAGRRKRESAFILLPLCFFMLGTLFGGGIALAVALVAL